MFRIACGPVTRDGWGQAPSEFWKMCPEEWWLLYDAYVGLDIKNQQNEFNRLHSLFDRSKNR